jgi:hypothetical protein
VGIDRVLAEVLPQDSVSQGTISFASPQCKGGGIQDTALGRIMSMTKTKATITVDRSKVDEVRRLTGARSTSAAIDAALTQVIRAERLRRDVAAYAAAPQSREEIELARTPVDWSELADTTDWDALYEQDS